VLTKKVAKMTHGERNMVLIVPGCIFFALCVGYAIAVLNRDMSGNSGAGDVRARIAARIAQIKQHQKRRGAEGGGVMDKVDRISSIFRQT
jgi:hypothetical protein